MTPRAIEKIYVCVKFLDARQYQFEVKLRQDVWGSRFDILRASLVTRRPNILEGLALIRRVVNLII